MATALTIIRKDSWEDEEKKREEEEQKKREEEEAQKAEEEAAAKASGGKGDADPVDGELLVVRWLSSQANWRIRLGFVCAGGQERQEGNTSDLLGVC